MNFLFFYSFLLDCTSCECIILSANKPDKKPDYESDMNPNVILGCLVKNGSACWKIGYGYAKAFLHLFYPRLCCCCGAPLSYETLFCLSCLVDLPKTDLPQRRDNELEEVFYGRIEVYAAASWLYFVKESRYNRLLYQLKYKDRPYIGRQLGRMMAAELKDTVFSRCDYIVPVPLHPQKLKKRGYNQSEWIARGIQDLLSIQLETGLVERVINTQTQTKKNRGERWENVKAAFRLTEKGKSIENKDIMVLDDVITTGATMEACASCLRDKNRVFFFSIAWATDW